MLACNDPVVDHRVSVANLPLSLWTSNIRSAQYLLPIGRIVDRIPRCVVARSVALARSGPMQNLSARRSAVTCV
jgi:hypothetical protein